MLHGETKFVDLLQNIQEFNQGVERATICLEEFQNIVKRVKFPLNF